MVKFRVTSGAIGLAVVLAVGVHALTDSSVVADACYLGVLVGASAGAWIGAVRAPPGRRSVPRLIAIGVSLTAMGDVVWTVLDRLGAGPDVSVADPLWFASYLFLCAALWTVLGRSQAGRVDLDLVIDAATIAVVSVLVFWSISVDAIIADQSVTPFVRTVWAGYPIADAILLALVVRVLLVQRSRVAIDASFAMGVCLWLAADIAYLQSPGSDAALTMMDTAWMVAPVLLARAAWGGGETEVDTSPVPVGGRVALVLAAGPLLVPPTLEIVDDLRGRPDQPFALFAGMSLLVALAFVRTGRLLRSEARALRELEVARDAALEASCAKSMFLASMSHEIRTPLTTVLASAEMLEDTPLDDLQLNLLAKMRRSGTLLMSLVDGVLDFSRVEAGQADLQSVEFDLHVLVADAVDASVARARRAGIRFEWHVDPCVPRILVGDPTRVSQVVNNLLENAVKFTHQGVVRLDIGARGEGVEFVVTDTGIGIREEDQAGVFESFRQVDGSETRRYGGNGLGLAICRELTELMGGSLTVRSRFGEGSTFVLRIPLAPVTRIAGLPARALPVPGASLSR